MKKKTSKNNPLENRTITSKHVNKKPAGRDGVIRKDGSISSESSTNNESHLRHALKIAKIASWEIDIKSGALSWSDEVYRIFKIPEKISIDYQGFLQLILPEDRDFVDQKWQAALKGEPYDIEHRIRVGRDIKWVNAKAELEFDNTGSAIRGVGIVKDITARKAEEDELRLTKINYRMIADYTYDWEWWISPDNRFRYVSPACERITGYQADQFIENPSLLREMIVPEDKDKWDRHVHGSDQNAGPREMQFRIKRSDGEIRWIEHACQPVFTRENQFLGFRGSNRDLTGRKQVDEALQMSEIRLLKAQEVACMGSWELDLVANSLVWSDEIYRIFGVSKEAPMTFEKFIEIVHPEDRDYVSKKWDAALKGAPYDIEHRLLVDNEVKWVREKAELIFDGTGTPKNGVGVTQEITERKQSELALKKSYDEIKKLKRKLEQESVYLRDEINLANNYKNIIGTSNAIQYVLFKVEQVAEADTTVLILGETGTGKELIARAIHQQSRRGKRQLVKINCATLPAHLIESELFGHERGSFTGAFARHTGRFEIADGSTIFLDEIGELPLELQSKLLRILEDGEYERLGGTRTIKADVRIIAATNRDLEKDSMEGRFRKDLWFRLNVFPITMPPLRERVEDIPPIVQHYMKIFARKQGKNITSVSSNTLEELQKYTWPGNVRELENIVERAVVTSSGSKLQLTEKLHQPPAIHSESFKSLHDIERDYIIKVLEKTGWKVSGKNSAAEILKLDRSTLRSKMQRMDIYKP
jgi:PAS domain S-box-containing protein